MTTPNQQIIKTPESSENSFHYLAFFSRLLKYWYLYPLSFAVMLLVALYYIRFNQSTYEVSTTLLIKNESLQVCLNVITGLRKLLTFIMNHKILAMKK